ncbi:UNVERIFIED_CONTAM: hypothetical protein Sangu_3041200 [Sesamum angustifolium]|uniref:Uncharacterized protein n=1 Tax=Sesamum angustifolium TaxID=2727405 RepID=A0AAW2KEB8_9LAMI
MLLIWSQVAGAGSLCAEGRSTFSSIVTIVSVDLMSLCSIAFLLTLPRRSVERRPNGRPSLQGLSALPLLPFALAFGNSLSCSNSGLGRGQFLLASAKEYGAGRAALNGPVDIHFLARLVYQHCGRVWKKAGLAVLGR